MDIPTFLQHLGFSLGAAAIASAFALAAGWASFKIGSSLLERFPKCGCILTFLPVRTIVFGLAGTVLLSPLGWVYFVLWFRFTPYWTLVSSSIGLAIVGAWIYALHLLRIHNPTATETNCFALLRTLFVASPWLCLKPGLFMGGSGGGSLVMKGATQLDVPLMWAGTVVIIITSLLIDLAFGTVKSIQLKKLNKR